MLFIKKYIRSLIKSTTPQIPPGTRQPCHICYCIRNRAVCVESARNLSCSPSAPGCQPVFEDGVCCPVSYNCSGEFTISSDNLVVIPLLREAPIILSRQI